MAHWTVTDVRTELRTVDVTRSIGESRMGIAVPFYLPMPEVGSVVTIDGNSVVAVLTLPSLAEYNNIQPDHPATVPGDYLVKIPGRGFWGFLKNTGSLVMGYALSACKMEIGREGIEFRMPSMKYFGTDISFSVNSASFTDPGSKASFSFNIGGILALELNSDSIYLSLHDRDLEAVLDSEKFRVTALANKKTGERVTLFNENFTNDDNSSSSGMKQINVASAIKAVYARAVDISARAGVTVKASEVSLNVDKVFKAHSRDITMDAGNAATIQAPDITLAATPGTEPAGHVMIANGQLSSIEMNSLGDVAVGIGPTGRLYLGGVGEFAANGLVLTRIITNISMALHIIATACGGFPPTSAANGANAPIALVDQDITNIANTLVWMADKVPMPNNIVL